MRKPSDILQDYLEGVEKELERVANVICPTIPYDGNQRFFNDKKKDVEIIALYRNAFNEIIEKVKIIEIEISFNYDTVRKNRNH